MNHSFKSSYGQCQCLWCGRWRGSDCQVTSEMREWLYQFSVAHGRTWRAAIREQWNRGIDEGMARMIRNVIGPNNIDKVTTARLLREHDRRQNAANRSADTEGAKP